MDIGLISGFVVTGAWVLVVLVGKRFSDCERMTLVLFKRVSMVVLGGFGVLAGNPELILPDVFARVLANLEVLFRGPGLGLVHGILSRAWVLVVFVGECSANRERLTLVLLKRVSMVVLCSFGKLVRPFKLVSPDVLTSVLSNLEVLLCRPGLGLVHGVLARAGV